MEDYDREFARLEKALLGGAAPPAAPSTRCNPSGARRRRKKITSDGFVASVTPAMRIALCLILEREYACLANLSVEYTMPPALASAC
jgi:hypothetical protein